MMRLTPEGLHSPAARLRFIRQSKFESAAAFARHIGVPEVSYRAHESGLRGLDERTARRYAAALGVSWVWLYTGQGALYGRDEEEDREIEVLAKELALQEAQRQRTAEEEEAFQRANGINIPIFEASAGGPDGSVIVDPAEVVGWIRSPRHLMRVRRPFAIYVIGNTMEPRYEQGETVLVNPVRPPGRDVDVLISRVVEHGRFYGLIRRLVGWTDMHWLVHQYNPPLDYEIDRSEWPRAQVIVSKENRM